MGNLYTDNLIGTVIGLSVADDWEGARREWEIVGCEVDETGNHFDSRFLSHSQV